MRKLLIFLMLLGWGLRATAANGPSERLSFTNEPYVHPALIEDWVGPGDVKTNATVSLALPQSSKLSAGKASGYNVETNAVGYPWVSYTEGEAGDWQAIFGYRCIGVTTSGVSVLKTSSYGGGSGVWKYVLFVSIDHKKGLLKNHGHHSLGDRWKGQLKLQGNKLYIGKDHGWFSKSIDRDALKPRTNDWAKVVEVPALPQ